MRRASLSLGPDVEGDRRVYFSDATSTRLISAIYIVALYYLSYRYPFKINSSLTSPSYSDTPALLQQGKYAIFLILIAAAAVHFGVSRSSRVYRRASVPGVLPIALAGLSISSFVQAISANRVDLIANGIFLLLPAIFLLAGPLVQLSGILGLIRTFLVIAILAEFLQLALFFAVGRLPALAYAGTTSIRFGSLWDDPNGFAIAIAFLLPIAWMSFQRLRVLLVASLAVMLVLTQSVTGIVCVITAVSVLIILRVRRKSPWVGPAFVIILVLGYVWISQAVESPLLSRFITGKTGSVEGHLLSIQALSQLTSDNFLGLVPMGANVESGYVDLLGENGLLFTITYIAVLFALIRRALRNADAAEAGAQRSVHLAHACLGIGILIGLINLPLESIFPLNLLFALAITVEFGNLMSESRFNDAIRG